MFKIFSSMWRRIFPKREAAPLTYTEDGLANCYMVVPGGRVSIPITRAIKYGKLPKKVIAKVETLWDDNKVIKRAKLSGFGVSRIIKVKASPMEGNAVVALRDEAGTIYWSWHIWVTNYNPNTKATCMDRNLGATEASEKSPASYGLFYQWGRKDPFPGGEKGCAGYAALSKFKGMPDAGNTNPVYITKTSKDAESIATGILESIRNPTTFYSQKNNSSTGWLPSPDETLWSTAEGKKTVYDPSPAGWRVPETFEYPEEYATNTDENNIEKAQYPNAGHRDPENGKYVKRNSVAFDRSGVYPMRDEVHTSHIVCNVTRTVRCVPEVGPT
jgi:hypothetical protein